MQTMFLIEAVKGRTWPIRGTMQMKDVQVGDTVLPVPRDEDVLLSRHRTFVTEALPSIGTTRGDGPYARGTKVVCVGSHLLYLPGLDGQHRPASMLYHRLTYVFRRYLGHDVLIDTSRASTAHALVPLHRDGYLVVLLYRPTTDVEATHYSVSRQNRALHDGRRVSSTRGETHGSFQRRRQKFKALIGVEPIIRMLKHDHPVKDLEIALREFGALP